VDSRDGKKRIGVLPASQGLKRKETWIKLDVSRRKKNECKLALRQSRRLALGARDGERRKNKKKIKERGRDFAWIPGHAGKKEGERTLVGVMFFGRAKIGSHIRKGGKRVSLLSTQ